MKYLLLIPIIALILFLFPRQKPLLEIIPLQHPLSVDSLRSRQYVSDPLIKINPQVIQFTSDGLKERALILIPSGKKPETGWPLVIINHGHIPEYQYSTENSYLNTSKYFASQGFMVLKPDFRGHDKSEGYASGRLLARSEFAVDVLNLLSLVKTMPDVNQNRIFMYGHSMGGDVTLLVLESTSQIRAASLWAPASTTFPEAVTHFVKTNQPTKKDLDTFNTQYAEYQQKYPLSQITAVDNLNFIQTPLNIHHGTSDQSVPYDWGIALRDQLKTLNKSVNFYSYVGDNHDISLHWSQALARDVVFFDSFK